MTTAPLERPERSYTWLRDHLQPGRCFLRAVCGDPPYPVQILQVRDGWVTIEVLHPQGRVTQYTETLGYLATDEWWEPLDPLEYAGHRLAY